MAEIVFLLAAEIDIQAIYDRLEEQREGGGDRFLRHLRELEILLAANPNLGVHVARGIRKLLLPRFDHGIFYTVEGVRIIVSAVLDLRRDPAFIRSRPVSEPRFSSTLLVSPTRLNLSVRCKAVTDRRDDSPRPALARSRRFVSAR